MLAEGESLSEKKKRCGDVALCRGKVDENMVIK